MNKRKNGLTGEVLIELDKVCFAYPQSAGNGGALVLEDVSFSVRCGEFVCVVGPNGGGKSTLLKLLLGLEKPGTGTIKIFGLPPGKVSRRIGYLPQNPQFDPAFR